MKPKLIESQHSSKICKDAFDSFLSKGVYDTSTHSFLVSDYRLGEPNTANFSQVQ